MSYRSEDTSKDSNEDRSMDTSEDSEDTSEDSEDTSEDSKDSSEDSEDTSEYNSGRSVCVVWRSVSWLTLGGDAILVGAAREAPVVGVQSGDVAGTVAPWGGALDLFLVCMVREGR